MFIDLAEVAAQQPDAVRHLLHAGQAYHPPIGSVDAACSGRSGWSCWSSACSPRWRSRSSAWRRRRRKSSATASAAFPPHSSPAALVSARVQRPSRGGAVFNRIVVGTDGSETASRGRSPGDRPRQALRGRRSTSSAPTSRSPRVASAPSRRDAPADVQYEIGPREDVNLILDNAVADAKKRGRRGPAPTRSRATPPTRSSTSPRRPRPT